MTSDFKRTVPVLVGVWVGISVGAVAGLIGSPAQAEAAPPRSGEAAAPTPSPSGASAGSPGAGAPSSAELPKAAAGSSPSNAKTEGSSNPEAPAAEGDAPPEPPKKSTHYQFTGLDIDGELRTPALLQFLSRIGGEFETMGIPHRSFMPELQATTNEDAL